MSVTVRRYRVTGIEPDPCGEFVHGEDYDALADSIAHLNLYEIELAVLSELAEARKKYPTWPTDPLHAHAVLGEECGELLKAILQTTYEPHKANRSHVRKEALQTAAMALRFLESLDLYVYSQCEQHQQHPPRDK
jgi:NTP pyrophosphatase (non-canonical NTP hydrolase)